MAQHKIGFYLEKGYGCEKDAKAAIEWYEKACAEGKTTSSKRRGRLANTGYIRTDPHIVTSFIGFPDSAHNLAILYQAVEPAVGVQKDLKKAVEYFEKAKQWGYAPAANACKSGLKNGVYGRAYG
jgi:TPR repeat protein